MSNKSSTESGNGYGLHSARIELEGENAKSVYSSVLPEIGDIDGRSKTDIYFENDKIIFEVSAPDLVALRAGINTWLRLSQTAESASVSINSTDSD